MKREIWTWALLGGLLASTYLNIQLMCQVEALNAPPASMMAPIATPLAEPLPDHVVDKLGLTKAQCVMITDCSMT